MGHSSSVKPLVWQSKSIHLSTEPAEASADAHLIIFTSLLDYEGVTYPFVYCSGCEVVHHHSTEAAIHPVSACVPTGMHFLSVSLSRRN